jgi:Ca2+-binding EF-hand superfamily protein
MASRKNSTLAVFFMLGVLGSPVAVTWLTADAFAQSALTTADTDKDGTLDLAEVRAAASSAFDSLDQDKDTTLDYKETAGHLNKKEFKSADTDKDHTLTKDEYLALVEKLFKAADQNNDGTLTAAELRTKAARALERLLK